MALFLDLRLKKWTPEKLIAVCAFKSINSFLLFSAFEQKNIIKEIIAKTQTTCRGDLTSGLGFKKGATK